MILVQEQRQYKKIFSFSYNSNGATKLNSYLNSYSNCIRIQIVYKNTCATCSHRH